jgi:hypothetical protein
MQHFFFARSTEAAENLWVFHEVPKDRLSAVYDSIKPEGISKKPR